MTDGGRPVPKLSGGSLKCRITVDLRHVSRLNDRQLCFRSFDSSSFVNTIHCGYLYIAGALDMYQ